MTDKIKRELLKEECSYCGQEITLPEGFMPDFIEKVESEKYDEKTGCFLVEKTVALLACGICHRKFFSIPTARKRRR